MGFKVLTGEGTPANGAVYEDEADAKRLADKIKGTVVEADSSDEEDESDEDETEEKSETDESEEETTDSSKVE